MAYQNKKKIDCYVMYYFSLNKYVIAKKKKIVKVNYRFKMQISLTSLGVMLVIQMWLLMSDIFTSTPAAGTGGFALGGFGAPTSTPAATSTTSTLGFGSSVFAQKPATGFNLNTPASGSLLLLWHIH